MVIDHVNANPNTKGVKRVLFIQYWELNPDFDPIELVEVSQTLIKKKVTPAEGEKILHIYFSTSEYWGITITVADSEEVLLQSAQIWRIAKPGIFKVFKISPVVDLVKAIPFLVQLGKKLKE